jgi:LuxR family maltose regulon positive regulatory protein
MTHLEAAALLDRTGLHLEADLVDRLVERTEGWPAALYLAALAIADQPSVEDAVARFSGADRLVADYLSTEFLAELSNRDRTFLRRTAILARLTAPLCDAVLGTRGSGVVLAELADSGMPLEPLDRSDTAFRHHALLAQSLRAELARLEPEREPALHRRAAVWHARHGDAAGALPHAVACRDLERTGALLWSLAPSYAADGRASLLGRWLEPFTDAELSAQPGLALAAAVHHLAGRRRERAERAVELAQSAPGSEAGEVAAAAALLRACLGRDGVHRMGEEAARARALAPPDSPWLSLALFLRGVALHLAGDREAACAALEDGAGRAAAVLPGVSAVCRAQLALLAIERGDWAGAAAVAPEASTGPTPVRALTQAVHAVVNAHGGDVAQAREDAAEARRLIATGLPPWLAAQVDVWLARAAIRLSDGPTARRLLARAARAQALVPDAPVLAQWLHDGWERADAFAAGATGDGPTLTNAELRVLRLLPSHLSFREIGQRLHVSANTVKTQALSVYRKLDVSCRSDAVARGRVTGLIDAPLS